MLIVRTNVHRRLEVPIGGPRRIRVNQQKTRICHVPEELFDFLGYALGRCYRNKTGQGVRQPFTLTKRNDDCVGTFPKPWQDFNNAELFDRGVQRARADRSRFRTSCLNSDGSVGTPPERTFRESVADLL
jgi:hypothetical protein